MAKETFYFSHDYGARNDPKLIKVLMKLGQQGKGVYWDLIEMMYEQEGTLLLSECDSYAFALRTDYDLINTLINDFDLFEKDSHSFWSNSVRNRLTKRNEKSKKAKDSAMERWNKAKNKDIDANALQTQCDGNAIKESKVKESKINQSKVNDFNKVVPPKKTVEERVLTFKESLYQYTNQRGGKYSSEMVNDFFEHYSELTHGGKKMLWETFKTFQPSSRLNRWYKNSLNFNKTKNYETHKKPIERTDAVIPDGEWKLI